MKGVRVDSDGNLRCWKCGGKNFVNKRTGRSKALVGVGALVTKKKLKCQQCGEYNDPGHAKPYDTTAPTPSGPPPGPPTHATPAAASPSIADELSKLATLRDQGVLSPAEFDAQKARLLGG